ncbi:hypothetical protein Pmani_016876 [Petrolisthes manimaculis]|uniref:Ig-like domain-containing protein n=1 Tax=Petrolisthes manimaculis TaxID=1843537 RepID=A0AAE1PQT7_9EUCA|nr:hypothetical protein Pmani_016876 [Petrolisthes manimaculis]
MKTPLVRKGGLGRGAPLPLPVVYKGPRPPLSEATTSTSPKLQEIPFPLSTNQANTTSLTCKIQAYPLPSFRWFKFAENGGRKAPVELGDRVKQVGGTLIIREAKVDDSGKYLCVVNNSVGGESVETVLTVTAPLSAQVEPNVQTVEFGRPATFSCTYRGNPVKSVTWLKDGTALNHKEAVLRIDSVGREDKGMYQCFIRNDQESAQATAELKLGGRFEPPQLTYTFETSTLQPGPSVYLKCVAAGNPTPEITWELDGSRLSNTERMQVGQYVTVNGEVVSHLNISGVLTNDGGLYACVASSTVGSVRHAAKLNVYGLPYIRPMDKVAVVAGENMVVHCPVAGYPIDSIVWEKNGRILPINRRQNVHPNGTLIVEAVERTSDQGRYTCVARNTQGYTARGDLDVQVMEPPQIYQVENLGEPDVGSEYMIPCMVMAGDSPINLVWYKDGRPVVPARMDSDRHAMGRVPGEGHDGGCPEWDMHGGVSSLNDQATGVLGQQDGIDTHITINKLGDRYSQLRFNTLCPHHSGNYSCVATNNYGSDSLPLIVQERPYILEIPAESEVFAGYIFQITCVAQSDPPPRITWLKDGSMLTDTSISVSYPSPMMSLLVIPQSQRKHAGEYTCVAQNPAGQVTKSSKLKVKDLPRIIPLMDTLEVLEGDSFQQSCIAQSSPPPLLRWQKDGSIVMDSSVSVSSPTPSMAIIIIPRVAKTHSGTYSCLASNQAGRVEESIVLTVNVPPEILPFGFPEEVTEGQLIQISCTANGDDPITLQWYKDDLPLMSSAKFIINKVDSKLSNLVLRGVVSEHSGKYACAAFSPVGEARYEKELRVKVEPQILPFAFPTEVEEGQLIQVSCAVTKGDDPLTLQWYKDGVPLISSNHFMINNVAPKLSLLLLSSVNANHTGTYSCLAFNPIGTAESSASLRVKVAPHILPFTFRDDVEAGQLVQVSCALSEGDEPMTLQWYKDDMPLISSPEYMISNVDTQLSLLLLRKVNDQHRAAPDILPLVLPEEVEEGQLIQMSCTVTKGDSPIIITWYKDSLPLHSSAEFLITNVDSKLSILLLRSVTANHRGSYVCEASNSAGTTRKSSVLNVKGIVN